MAFKYKIKFFAIYCQAQLVALFIAFQVSAFRKQDKTSGQSIVKDKISKVLQAARMFFLVKEFP